MSLLDDIVDKKKIYDDGKKEVAENEESLKRAESDLKHSRKRFWMTVGPPPPEVTGNYAEF